MRFTIGIQLRITIIFRIWINKELESACQRQTAVNVLYKVERWDFHDNIFITKRSLEVVKSSTRMVLAKLLASVSMAISVVFPLVPRNQLARYFSGTGNSFLAIFRCWKNARNREWSNQKLQKRTNVAQILSVPMITAITILQCMPNQRNHGLPVAISQKVQTKNDYRSRC